MVGMLPGEFRLVICALLLDLLAECLEMIFETPDFPFGTVGITPGIPIRLRSGIHPVRGRFGIHVKSGHKPKPG